MTGGERMAMRGLWAACSIALACGAAQAADPRPTAEEQARFVDAARQVALAYTDSLPNFLCAQTIRRYRIFNPTKARDVLEVEVGFENGRDSYRLTEVNGGPASRSLREQLGLTSTGEFGANLLRVFKTNARFRFERWTTLRGREAAVYSYAVRAPEAHYQLSYVNPQTGKVETFAAGLHGDIVVDRETYGILEVEYVADPPQPIGLRATSTVDYDFVSLNDRPYLLPAKGVVTMLLDRNEVKYHSYRKFETGSQLTFGEEPSGP
jgi:hypothetical protein